MSIYFFSLDVSPDSHIDKSVYVEMMRVFTGVLSYHCTLLTRS